MIHIEDQQIAKLLDYPALIDALATAFRTYSEQPPRQQFTINTDGEDDAHLLLMPAWQSGQKIGIKIATVFPGNADRDIPTVNASYLLLDATTGIPQMIMDASASGPDADADGDGDPRNDELPTAVVLSPFAPVPVPVLGSGGLVTAVLILLGSFLRAPV